MTDNNIFDDPRTLLMRLTSLTVNFTLHWERRENTAHRYAQWENHVLILGPITSLDDHAIPRYLSITAFDSPEMTEITTEDPFLRLPLLALIYAVEAATMDQEPRDPFALNQSAL